MESLRQQFVDLVKMAAGVDEVKTFGDFNTYARKPYKRQMKVCRL